MAEAAATTPLFASLTGPTQVAINEKHQYQVIAVGGPGEGRGGNYSFTFNVVGSSNTNALVTPSSGISTTGRFSTVSPASQRTSRFRSK
jgi:hypothetical protein